MAEIRHRNALNPGYQLQWYIIQKVLGQGGFGITYLARDTNLDQLVAIKEYLPSDLATRDQDSSVSPLSTDFDDRYKWGLERFISEARTLARFKHPNIVRVYNVFNLNNTAYMTMEYEHGKSLHEIFNERKTLDENELTQILFPILDGLQLVHEKGFIHRDIKPANIFIREDNSPVLIDFGSARMALNKKTVTLTSIISPGYAPFEQYYSKSDRQGPWTDIYALGATLYRGITGRAPINAVDRSEAILKTSRDLFATASDLGKGRYSDTFLKAVDRALKFNEKDRPQTINEWLEEFGDKERSVATAEVISEKEPSFSLEGTTLLAMEQVLEMDKRDTPPQKAAIPSYRVPLAIALAVGLVSITSFITYRLVSKDTEVMPARVEGQASAQEEKHVLQEKQKASAEMHELLSRAEDAFKQGRLVDPSGNSAYGYYLRVMEMDPANQVAATGIESVISALLSQAEKALAHRDYALADDLLNQLAGIAPANESTIELQGLLARGKAEKEKAGQISARVSELLARAGKNMQEMRLTSPAEDNALYNYQQALELEPDNSTALEGVRNIAEKYIFLARQAIQESRLDQAEEYLATADGLWPDSDQVKQAYLQLNESKTELKKREEALRQEQLADEARRKEEELQKQLAREQQLAREAEEARRLAEAEKIRIQEELEQRRLREQELEQLKKEEAEKRHVEEETRKKAEPLPAGKETAAIQTSTPKAVIAFSGHKADYQSVGMSEQKIKESIREKLSAAGWEVITDDAVPATPDVKQINVKIWFTFSSFGPSSYSTLVSVKDKLPHAVDGEIFTKENIWSEGQNGVFIPGSGNQFDNIILGLIDKFLASVRH